MGVQPSIRQVGKYTILDVIGTGGMGIVYRANDPAIGRTVAIKMLREAESPGGLFDRFFSREMKSTGNLHHRNIVTVYDTGFQDGKPYLVMEYLEGEPTSKLIAERRQVPLVEKLDLVIQVCDGLQYAHDRNIIHRDIKPANVIVLSDGTAKIVDFGLARNVGVESTTVQTGHLVGSLSYMSPEQINSIPVDARSDVFSTGVMLYELLTYQLPFKGDDVASTFVKILREEPKPLAQHGTEFPPGLQAVISRALEKNANDRYQTAEEFGFELLSVQKVLKAASIADCMKWAEAAAHRGDLERARLHLQEVIRLDRQNERANRLVREVRRAIQQQQRTSQVIQMRSQAQVALAGAQYEEALACADQALRLDPTNTESIRLCDEIRNAITRVKAVREALNRAESALLAGDLDEAKEAVEESLRLDASDSEARALASVINTELAERSRRQRVQVFVDQARREIAERKFSDALDALHQAEELDPSDSNVHELMQWALRGHEQEKKRRFLQDITDQIEKALHAGDFTSACTISEMGLSQFPDEPTLVRLRAISEKQRDIAERRRFVNEQSLAVKALSEQGKLQEAVQLLTQGLAKYRSEPNLESLLANTRLEIERIEFERQEVERQHALERAEAEARAQLTQEVLNRSVELRRSLDARSEIGELRKTAQQLRLSMEGQHIDAHAIEVAEAVLDEVDSRLRARDQALAELEQLRRVVERPHDTTILGESENRLLSINAAFPHEPQVQQISAELAANLSQLRERRDHVLASLSALVKDLERTPTGDLTVLFRRARETATGFAGDAQIGALLQQVESTVTKRMERHTELLGEIASLSTSLGAAHSLEDLSRTAERAKSIAAQDAGDPDLADRARQVESDVARLRAVIDGLLHEMDALAQEVAAAPTVIDAEALAPRIKLLVEKRANFQELQEAAKRILTGIQGRRMEHDLIVQELESLRASLPVLESDQELEAAAARAGQCLKSHPNDPAVRTISAGIAQDVEPLLRERAAFRARTLECDNALHLAGEKIRTGDWEGALNILLRVEGQNPERADLRLQITVVRKALEQQRAEQESIESERIARERAEAEARAREAAIEQAIQTARRLLSEDRLDDSAQCLRDALTRYPGDEGLQSALASAETEAARRRAEREQQERERLEREALERARKTAADLAISEAKQLLAGDRAEESVQRLQTALEHDASNSDLRAALLATQNEIERRAEVVRERQRQEQLAREKAAAEARERNEAAKQAIRDASKLLAQEQEDRALELLRKALDRDPANPELTSKLKLMEAEAARAKGERERLEREALERARKTAADLAISEAKQLLAGDRGEESVQRLRTALEHDASNSDLRAALLATQNELEQRRAEVERERQRQEQLAREKAAAEARERNEAAEQAIRDARNLLAQEQEDRALKLLRKALDRDPANAQLTSTLKLMEAQAARAKTERERLERERVAREQAEAQERARKAAAQLAIDQARALHSQGESAAAIALLRTAIGRDVQSVDLPAALEGIQTDLARRRAEQERRERERVERELLARNKAEAEERARKQAAELAIRESRDLLVRKRTDESLQRLNSALKQDPENGELQAALLSTQAEIARQKSEQDRLEKERQERERLACEQAESEARARKAAADKAIKEAKDLLADGLGEEAVRKLRNAWDKDNKNSELRTELDAAEAEFRRIKEEKKRQEKEKKKQEKLEREQLQAKGKRAATDEARAVEGKAEAEEAAVGMFETASATKKAAGEPAVHPQVAAARRNRLIAAGAAIAALLAVGAFFVFRSGSSAELPITLQIEPTDAHTTVDGIATECLATCALRMKPGKHTITLQKQGYTEQTQSIMIADSDTNRTIALRLTQSSGGTSSQVTQPPAQEAQQTTRTQPVAANNRQASSPQQKPSQNQVPVPRPVQPQPPQVASTPSPAPVQVPADVTAWNEVKDTHNLDALRDFRKNFPSSQFAREAYGKMDEMTWSSVHDSTQLADLQRYLNDYPDGHHSAEARERINSLQKAQESAKAQEAEKAQALQQTQQQAQKQAQQRDHDLVLQTLDAYRQAYEAKDLNALSAVWITAPRQNLEKVFKLADKIRVGLTPESVTISGDTATISCHQRLEVTATSKNVNERLVVFSLKKQQGKWVIESAK